MTHKQDGIAGVLARAMATLDTARLGLADLRTNDPGRRLAGLSNLVVFGRAVTNVLQNIRTHDAAWFDRWYVPIQEEMRQDPLLKFLYDLRSAILKEGQTGVASIQISIGYLDIGEMMRTSPQPPGATEFTVDLHGRGRWHVPLPDGSVEMYYAPYPPGSQISVSSFFSDPPTMHLGKPIPDTSVEELASLYLEFLTDLVGRAFSEFSTKA